MNRLNNAYELATFIENLPDNEDDTASMGLDMCVTNLGRNATSHPCGTAMCIGGWVCYLNPELVDFDIEDATRTLFDASVDTDLIYTLCYPNTDAGWLATPQEAAAAIRRVINHQQPWTE